MLSINQTKPKWSHYLAMVPIFSCWQHMTPQILEHAELCRVQDISFRSGLRLVFYLLVVRFRMPECADLRPTQRSGGVTELSQQLPTQLPVQLDHPGQQWKHHQLHLYCLPGGGQLWPWLRQGTQIHTIPPYQLKKMDPRPYHVISFQLGRGAAVLFLCLQGQNDRTSGVSSTSVRTRPIETICLVFYK